MKHDFFVDIWTTRIKIIFLTLFSMAIVGGVAYLIYSSIWKDFTSSRVSLNFKYPWQLTPHLCKIGVLEEFSSQVEKISLGSDCDTNPGRYGYIKVARPKVPTVISDKCTKLQVGNKEGYKCSEQSYFVFSNTLEYDIEFTIPQNSKVIGIKGLFNRLLTTIKF